MKTRVYVLGDNADVSDLANFCQGRGFVLKRLRRFGRPRRRVPRQKLLVAYKAHRSVEVVAELTGIPSSTVRRALTGSNPEIFQRWPPIHRLRRNGSTLEGHHG